MLTKRQLEDAAECLARFHERTCGQCSCNKFRYGYVGSYGCTENAAQTALAYREMLERLEFSNLTWDGAECAICGGRNEHEDECGLAALLEKVRGEVMLSVGKLKEICEYIEREHGSDCKVVVQVYDKNDKRRILGGDYALDYGWGNDGTLYLTNGTSEKVRG